MNNIQQRSFAMRRVEHRKIGMVEYYQPFSQLYEKFEGDTFLQSIIDKLYQQGSCYFSRKEALGSRIAFLLGTVQIPFKTEQVDDATFKIVIVKKESY